MAFSKLNDELINKACDYIAQGHYVNVVCDFLNISEVTYYNYIKQAKEDEKNNEETIFTKFFKSIKEAEAKAEMRHLQNILKSANDGTWQASAWYLERKHKDRWSIKQEHQHSGNVKIKVGLSDD